MREDPVVDEIRRIRDEVFREHGSDVHELFRAMRTREEAARQSGTRVVTLQPKRLESSNAGTRSLSEAQAPKRAG